MYEQTIREEEISMSNEVMEKMFKSIWNTGNVPICWIRPLVTRVCSVCENSLSWTSEHGVFTFLYLYYTPRMKKF